jgi:hypothetical protein
MDWYNRRRGHSARDNLPPVRDDDPPILTAFPVGEIVCDSELGGHLKSYRRVAQATVVRLGKVWKIAAETCGGVFVPRAH